MQETERQDSHRQRRTRLRDRLTYPKCWICVGPAATPAPTNNALTLIGTATHLLRTIWRDGYRYTKGGVFLNNLAPAEQQASLFDVSGEQSQALMVAMDAINRRFGKEAIKPLSIGIEWGWQPRQEMLSRRFTTRFDEILGATSF